MNITDKAITKLKSIREEGKALRVSVVGGGCAGYSYNMKWVALGETTLQDKVSLFDDITAVIDLKSYIFLTSVELDYSDDLNNSGFKWSNKVATKSCGCGSSFST